MVEVDDVNNVDKNTDPVYSSLAGDAELRELFVLYVNEIPGRIANLESCLALSDWAGLKHLLHQLRGSAGSYGFARIALVAENVQTLLDMGAKPQDIRNATHALINLCKRISSEKPSV